MTWARINWFCIIVAVLQVGATWQFCGKGDWKLGTLMALYAASNVVLAVMGKGGI